ncbi:MAG TPA: asparaginase [bacterium]|nr:asparaginase [bacterium]
MARAPLVQVTRGTVRESLHRGAVAVVDRAGRLRYRAGDPDLELFLRSSAKPLQAIPLIESGAADTLGLGEQEVAVTCGSHSAEPDHLTAVRSILEKAGLDEGALQCGVHPPVDATQAAELARAGRTPTALHHNCSGKHAGMLATCRVRGWPLDTYRAPDHPVQHEIAGIVGEFCGVPSAAMAIGTDGCGVPTFHLTVAQTALAFARLADPSDLAPRRSAAAARLVRAMVAHPGMVAGTGRLDTVLMETFPGRLVAKEGAEGVSGIGLIDLGWGIGVKIEDGNRRGLGAVILETLRQLEFASASDLDTLAAHYRPEIRGTDGRAVGEMRAVFTLEKVS